ncbi:MAG: hypothetical protein PHW44_05505 [Candidatus Omnitrophica bacterium]|jgi:hypothetical protein|nr:hypothetical protein [Candidatus Omnitrophota bacterium]
MSQYLRDETLKNLNLQENAIKEINKVLLKIKNQENGIVNNDINNEKYLQLSYIIRFDKKGFWLYKFDETMEYFCSAKDVERFVFVLKSSEHDTTIKNKGKCVEIHFDSRDSKNCFITVQDDDQAWVDSTFLRIQEVIGKFTNLNYLARNPWTNFAIQMSGVVLGLLFSLWVAFNFSNKLNIPAPSDFGFSFLIAFLLFSNMWTYLYPTCLKIVDFLWPNILFKEKRGVYKIAKGLIGTLFVTYCMIVIGWILKSFWSFVLFLFSKRT